MSQSSTCIILSGQVSLKNLERDAQIFLIFCSFSVSDVSFILVFFLFNCTDFNMFSLF